MKYLLVITVILFINLTQNYSQIKDSSILVFCGTEIDPGYVDCGNSLIGPVMGYSFKSIVLFYGINYEYAFAQNRTGIFTSGISVKYGFNSEKILDNTAKLKTSVLSLGLQCIYNLNRLSSKSIVPFAGLIIGYNYSVSNYDFDNNILNPLFPDTKKHSLFFLGHAGIRFFVFRNLALTLKAGSGNIDKSVNEFGFDYKF